MANHVMVMLRLMLNDVFVRSRHVYTHIHTECMHFVRLTPIEHIFLWSIQQCNQQHRFWLLVCIYSFVVVAFFRSSFNGRMKNAQIYDFIYIGYSLGQRLKAALVILIVYTMLSNEIWILHPIPSSENEGRYCHMECHTRTQNVHPHFIQITFIRIIKYKLNYNKSSILSNCHRKSN